MSDKSKAKRRLAKAKGERRVAVSTQRFIEEDDIQTALDYLEQIIEKANAKIEKLSKQSIRSGIDNAMMPLHILTLEDSYNRYPDEKGTES